MMHSTGQPPKKRRFDTGPPNPFHYYPSIPDDVQDLPGNRPFPMLPDLPMSCTGVAYVEKTDSTQWGTVEIASARAILEPTITPENEHLIRTYHPALSVCRDVYTMREMSGKLFWMAIVSSKPISHTHAGGREIHIVPAMYTPDPLRYLIPRPIYISRLIYPRRMLTAQDIAKIQQYYPSCVGVRILISGYIIFLFRNILDMRSAWKSGNPDDVGGLIPGFDIIDMEPSTETMPSGYEVSHLPDSFISRVCLGLRIRRADGSEAVTTVTHGFVKRVESTPRFPRLASWLIQAKRSLSRFMSPRNLIALPGEVGHRGESLGSSALGKSVYIQGEAIKIGTITTMYDEPSTIYPYPAGYRHDLSLFTDSNLPEITSPPGVGIITGWANYVDALDGQPVFTTRFDVGRNRREQQTGTVSNSVTKEAIIEGSEYTWVSSAITASLLWRTRPDDFTLIGFSGSVLCLGRPSDETIKAVVFQNYCTQIKGWQMRDGERELQPHGSGHGWMKAGFLLPREVKECTIICKASTASGRGFNSLPIHEKASTSISDRRFFTGPY
ncbi:hypothetical protein MferCBS49748_003823 [Microsporum ferrugineum]